MVYILMDGESLISAKNKRTGEIHVRRARFEEHAKIREHKSLESVISGARRVTADKKDKKTRLKIIMDAHHYQNLLCFITEFWNTNFELHDTQFIWKSKTGWNIL